MAQDVLDVGFPARLANVALSGHSPVDCGAAMNKIHDDFEAWLASVPTTEEVLSGIEPTTLPDYRRDPSFVADLLKGMVTQAVLEAMEEEGTTRSDLAAVLGRSKQYVGRVLNENANFTLDSLARIACALDREVKVVLHRADERVTVSPLLDECYSDLFETVATVGGNSLVSAGGFHTMCSESGPEGRTSSPDDGEYTASPGDRPEEHGDLGSAKLLFAA